MNKSLSKEYKYIFGPVPSRRLGISLGVDLMLHKTCTLDCVYCESGKTTCLTTERKEYVPTDAVISELDRFLSESPELDCITFSGSGEPTLHSGIGVVINHIKENHPAYKVAILTNSTLFSEPQLRRDVRRADLIIASVDAVSEKAFLEINRPHEALALQGILSGLADLREGFAGELWLEFFMIPGINDGLPELEKIKTFFDDVRFDRIQINSLDRPGTETWVKPVERAALEEVQRYFSHRVELIEKAEAFSDPGSGNRTPVERILSTVRRRPVTLEDIVRTLGMEREAAAKALEDLLAGGRIDKKEMDRGTFYLLN